MSGLNADYFECGIANTIKRGINADYFECGIANTNTIKRGINMFYERFKVII